MKKDIERLRRSMSSEEVVSFMDTYHRYVRVATPIDIDIDPQSNLWPDRFELIMSRLCLKCEYIKLYNTEIKALVGRRNGIAHGEKLIISDVESYEKFEKCVFLVMHELAFEISENLEKEMYKKKRYRRKSLNPV